ncbi:MAG: phosphoribosylformylglycinamidine synthase [Bacteroidales bacterium]|nr:phosphoribosylformylglycinamidine synthase [Bacteroidales bacterium]MCM1148357.1 phosphoribosylformylglycinamidine synthase [Bacteroidales bacterium]MCM1207030.1 phosphoribosylformylglycinamidine synthase [Bacillota bacterium]MCM1511300.1 phosphoribosylformylglycinamidine synthase [Clostridium sp.]
MILFFKTPSQSIVATQIDHQPAADEVKELCWLYSNATLLGDAELEGFYVGPRREMITPWSTNAVEITQNMGLKGISRIEEYWPVDSADAEHDSMLQRMYGGLDQNIFTVDIKPEPIKHVENLEEYNEQEGLALSKEEIEYLHKVEDELGRPLTDSEIFGFAQINSEHCRHKIFGGTFIIDGEEKESSLFQMIKKTTKENPNKILSAYKDNVAFSAGPEIDQFAPADHSRPDLYRVKRVKSVISLKAETHNFPTTVEPFNGAATGTGGEIRDRMGGGVGSWPIAGTAVYMTSYPRKEGANQAWEKIMPVREWLYQTPEQILIKASNGASDFGNKFGQPLICGSVLTFEHQEKEEQYAYDKVIMLAGGVGYGIERDCLKGEPQAGNKVVVMGGENYRIGLGGGSVSSVETGRYSSGIELNAVQRANPEMQKRAYNVIRALGEEENNPIVSIHDHGSAGHVNCLSELVEECGGLIHMDKLPVGDKTLSAKEIIANESQERMGLLIDEAAIEHVQKIADRERAPMYTVGETTGDRRFAFEQADGVRPFDLSVDQMFGSSPKTFMVDKTVERKYDVVTYGHTGVSSQSTLADTLTCYVKNVLQLEAVACKDWLTNKVDRSVTGRVARQQCQGELQLPLSDCGAVALDYNGEKGIATSIGHAPQAALADPEAGSVLSVAEALTNLVWAPMAEGTDSISLSANWMWPCRSQEGEDARLYKAVKALSDFCCDLQINVPTGKDSLSMTQKYPDGKKIIAPGTVIVSAGGEVSDVRKVVSPVIKKTEASRLYYIDFSFDSLQLGGSAFAQSMGKVGSDVPTVKNPEYFRDAFLAVQELVKEELVLAGHDISAGGLITTLLEMCFANTEGGLELNLDKIQEQDIVKVLFAENPGVVIQVRESDASRVKKILEDAGVGYAKIGAPVYGNERKIIIAKTMSNAQVPNGKIAEREMTFEFDINELRDVWYSTSYLLDRRQSFNGKAAERFVNYKNIPVEWSVSGEPLTVTPRPEEKRPVAAIIREKGTNSEREMAYSFYMAGFDVKDVTMTDLITGCETLEEVNLVAFCGGFSNSDVLGSAKGWAGAFLFNPKAKEALDKFYARKDTLSLGVCNGCQLMVELGLLNNTTASTDARDYAQMLHNDSHKFESAFVTLSIPQNDSVMLGSLSGEKIGCWVAHGEGKFSLPLAEQEYNVVAKYNRSEYPGNPNGSDYNVAALASKDGRHLAIMPHPERTQFPWQCGYYPEERRLTDKVTPWHEAFVNARKWIEKNS